MENKNTAKRRNFSEMEIDTLTSEVKKKWSDLKLATKKRVAAIRRSSTQTGGSQPDPILSLTQIEERLASLIGSESIAGISGGGGDTASCVRARRMSQAPVAFHSLQVRLQHKAAWSQTHRARHVAVRVSPCPPLPVLAHHKPAIITAQVLDRQTKMCCLIAVIVRTLESINETLKEINDNMKRSRDK